MGPSERTMGWFVAEMGSGRRTWELWLDSKWGSYSAGTLEQRHRIVHADEMEVVGGMVLFYDEQGGPRTLDDVPGRVLVLGLATHELVGMREVI